jgi:hypothetical protein
MISVLQVLKAVEQIDPGCDTRDGSTKGARDEMEEIGSNLARRAKSVGNQREEDKSETD